MKPPLQRVQLTRGNCNNLVSRYLGVFAFGKNAVVGRREVNKAVVGWCIAVVQGCRDRLLAVGYLN